MTTTAAMITNAMGSAAIRKDMKGIITLVISVLNGSRSQAKAVIVSPYMFGDSKSLAPVAIVAVAIL
jgi:hypothetical protein